MEQIVVTKNIVVSYLQFLRIQEKSKGTLEKYARELRELEQFLAGKEVRKEDLLLWKENLEKTYSPAGVNGKLVAANGLFAFLGRHDLRMKLLKIQKEIFISEEKELTRAEYSRLVRTAERKGKERLSLLIQTICATGIRVSELQFITLEAVKRGRAEVNCKGKRRVIFLPVRLQKKLKAYAAKNGISKGILFVTRSGRPLHRGNIWAEMKKLCKDAEVNPKKVFPHNLRHLFARIFYSLDKDIAKLADMLGHSNIETTRIYIMESGRVHRQKLERMGLVL
ncbi:tyrosine-type recombinase/integrase [Anaerotignum sp.]|uniref:tyrosine-type recombinase/integrase n=1 Tax=Anaerotignum sp. TaxID=2039241 RepID=UPI002A91A2FE|nr:tyrosine-type recombinase/integrase [Anaerotignum sp.]MCI7657796.1 tyrosine-type recombinase/integrase [Clostridia bacterium]MDY5415730.1 tyrosine-type recombinase/integrase [Anaerotignum sp.]